MQILYKYFLPTVGTFFPQFLLIQLFLQSRTHILTPTSKDPQIPLPMSSKAAVPLLLRMMRLRLLKARTDLVSCYL